LREAVDRLKAARAEVEALLGGVTPERRDVIVEALVAGVKSVLWWGVKGREEVVCNIVFLNAENAVNSVNGWCVVLESTCGFFIFSH
jgi:hypothetical protein